MILMFSIVETYQIPEHSRFLWRLWFTYATQDGTKGQPNHVISFMDFAQSDSLTGCHWFAPQPWMSIPLLFNFCHLGKKKTQKNQNIDRSGRWAGGFFFFCGVPQQSQTHRLVRRLKCSRQFMVSSRSPVSQVLKTHLHWPVTTIKRNAARTWHVLVHTHNSVTSPPRFKVAWFVCLAEKLMEKRSMKCVCLLIKGQVCQCEMCSVAETI